MLNIPFRRGLSPDKVRNGGESEPQDEEEIPVSRTSTLIRYDTCPLDQVHYSRSSTLIRYDTCPLDQVHYSRNSTLIRYDTGPLDQVHYSRTSTLIRYDTCSLDQVHYSRTSTLIRYDTCPLDQYSTVQSVQSPKFKKSIVERNSQVSFLGSSHLVDFDSRDLTKNGEYEETI